MLQRKTEAIFIGQVSHEHCRKCLFVFGFVFLVTKGSNNQRAGLRRKELRTAKKELRTAMYKRYINSIIIIKTRKIRKVPFLAPTRARLQSSTLPGRLAKLVETETTATQAIDERTTTTVTSILFIPDHCITPNCCALCPLQ